MKKVFASLGVILLVAVLGVAVVFAYGSYKDLELKKEEAKVTENKQKNSKNKTSKKEQQNQTTNQTEIQESTNTNNTNEELNTDEFRTTEDGEEIKKTKNGIDYTGEFDSPEEEEEFEKGVMAQSGGGATNGENTDESSPKYTAEDAKNMSDDEFLDAYKEGMSEEEAAAVDSRAEGSGDYIGYLRGQVEARANGQGGNY
ncbi:TPA: hypothetical protein OTG90_002394 [Staphylococcus pseudintermedius]|uniref:hypothetical protein n=1 Tax=Staphylococcus cornubiensis TaxID=1986155 RepID=UPI000A36D15E|nr:hypothetical protein [Staphylococcus cornubiensis]EGQ1611845.1 hypothetical protein [Staphylococcus pseudintermedius]HDA7054215.1 hypothetical protein [Staphylococcus aureus]HAR6210856.1 hypothetical protein [Staphylococcus pseudintermedius]HCS9102227.1 hypothetical protein [Staphylococcus pseudintermedius]HCS9104544.1 hypothetical protein [Staphylococcus pseudintermedius]